MTQPKPQPIPVPDGSALTTAAADWELSPTETVALAQAARVLDVIADLEAALVASGVVTAAGRPSPLLPEIRQQRATLVKLLGLLDLRLSEDDDGQPVISPTSRSARAAARARWSRR